VSTLAAPADVLVEVKRVRRVEVVTISQEEHAQSVPSLYSTGTSDYPPRDHLGLIG